MSSRNEKERILDILKEIQYIQQFIQDISFDEFYQDQRTLKAVLYGLAVIGEATVNLSSNLKTTYHNIPWKQICAMRNITIHEYFQVDIEIVWETIQKDLPTLAKSLEIILTSM